MSDQQQPAGWYPTGVPGEQRYWDGSRWTEHTAQTAPATPPSTTVPPPPGPPVGSPSGGSGTAKVLIPVAVCVVLAVAAVVIGLVVSSGDDETADPTTTTEEPEDPAEPTDDPEGPGSADDPLALGQTAQVGDYEVTVVSVDLEGTDEILAENEFNEPPTNDEYALVTVRATYVGDDEGTPSSDLSVTLDGGDGVQYEEFECGAVTPNGTDFTTLTNGGAATYDLCWDYRAEAVDGGSVFVEAFLSTDEERTYWALE